MPVRYVITTLKAGENITLTLTTDSGATVVATAVVKALP